MLLVVVVLYRCSLPLGLLAVSGMWRTLMGNITLVGPDCFLKPKHREARVCSDTRCFILCVALFPTSYTALHVVLHMEDDTCVIVVASITRATGGEKAKNAPPDMMVNLSTGDDA